MERERHLGNPGRFPKGSVPGSVNSICKGPERWEPLPAKECKSEKNAFKGVQSSIRLKESVQT